MFLNGETSTHSRNTAQGEKQIKKTQMCLKGLKVERQLAKEAIKNYYNLTTAN